MHLQRLLPISVLLCLLVSPLLLGVWANENSSALRPNLIFILADDLGYGDLGCYGQTKIRTPNLDRLAAEGMRFTQHYSGNAVCAPSRCVLMTGLHPGHAFIRDNSETKPEGQMPIPAGTLTLARLLHQQGYVTGAFGKWGLGGPGTDGEPLNQGFDRFFGYNCQRLAHNYYPTSLWDNAERVSLNNPSFSPHDNFKPGEDPANPASYQRFQGVEYSADLIAEQALQFVRDHRHKPFFLFWPTTVPHLALQVPQDSLQEYEGRWDDPPYTGGRNYLPHYKPRAAYAAMVTRLDRDIGRLMKLVDELGLDERTVFVFTSDNGPLYGRLGGTDCDFFKSAGDLRGYKGSLYEGGIRVPCLVRWKGRIAAGGISHRVTGFEDWLPTLLELVKAKAAIPPGLDGISFVPTLLGQSQEPRPFLYREFPGYGSQQSIRLGDWKGVRQKLIPARNSQQLPQAHLELYNLADDPSEADDVSSHRPDLVAKMSRLLREQHQPSKEFPFPELDQAFRIQERHGVNWLITPRGERFFSLGVCCVNQGISRGDVNPRNPGYAAWQHYSHSNQWAEAVLKRLKSWGFNTIGGWSDYQTLKQQPDQDIRFTPVLHVGSTAGAPWWDMWHPTNIARMDQVAREQILPLRDDPRLLGYYTDNEMGWWNAALFQMTLQQAPGSLQRQQLIKLLRQTYHHNWPELLQDFEPQGVANWQDLDNRGMLFLRPESNGIHTMRRFLGMMAERYYARVHATIRQYDQQALILGDRYQSFYFPEVAQACSPYVDAVSSNLNASWNDGDFPRFYLDTLHALAGRPIMIGEFYMAARQNRSGNKNCRGVFPVVPTQKLRAAGFRNTLHNLLELPYIVGADWFQYYDEPTEGRGDGENYNFGLVDIHDSPYQELITASSAMNTETLKSRPLLKRPDASQGVPPAPRRPFADFQKPTLALKSWDRERGFIPPVSQFPMADLYVCWNKNCIYLGLYAQDVVETDLYRDKIVPEGDRSLWSVVTREISLRARIGAGRKPVLDTPAIRIDNFSGVNLHTRNIAAMELPARFFGKDRFQEGDEIELDSTFLSHARACRTDWRGKFILRAKSVK